MILLYRFGRTVCSLIVLTLAIISFSGQFYSPNDNLVWAQPSVKAIYLEAENFGFNSTQGGPTITVMKNDIVRVTLRNSGTGGPHTWTLDANSPAPYSVSTRFLETGSIDIVEFTADRAGTFTYYCTVPGHRQLGMEATIVILQPAKILKVESLDSLGESKTNFSPGEIVVGSSTVLSQATASRTFLISVQILAPDGTALIPQFLRTNFNPGQEFGFAPGISLPLKAQEGNWTIEVNVFSDFPAQGGVPDAQPSLGQFTVS